MKKIRKILPVVLLDLFALEQWLERMADEGFFPEYIGSWATFTKTGVPGTRFRLEAKKSRSTGPAPELIELYEESGWHYAFSIVDVYELFYTTDPSATELHPDLETRSFSLDELAKRVKTAKRKLLIVPGVFAIFALVYAFWPASQFDAQPDRWARLPLLLLHFTKPLFLFFLVICFLQTCASLRDYRTAQKTYEALRCGTMPSSHNPSCTIVWENRAALLLTPILAVCVLSLYIPHPTGAADFDQPYIALEDLEDEPLYTYEELFGESSRYSAEQNQTSQQFSLLAPTWYEVCQYKSSAKAGTQKNSFSPDPEGGKYRYSPRLDMICFSLTIPAIGKMVARAQMDVYRAINLCWEYEEVDCPGADFVILASASEGLHQMAAVGKGRHIAVFDYSGQQQLSEHIDLLVGILASR